MQTDWMTELDKQLRRGKHVLLYGNVEDRYELNDRYDPLDKCLDTYFQDRGYFGVIHYDIAEKGRPFRYGGRQTGHQCLLFRTDPGGRRPAAEKAPLFRASGS